MSHASLDRCHFAHVLTLQRPEAMNALSLDLITEVIGHLDTVEADATARCLIVTGAGRRAFCAGADLKERRGMSEDQARAAIARIGELIGRVASLPIPVIAAVGGVALGGGLELALACDLRVVSEEAVLGLTETRLAIIPGAGGTQRLARLIGPARAKDLIFTGRKITAAEGLAMGLVDRLTSADRLMPTALELADEIGAGGPVALRAAKRAVDCGLDATLEEGLAIERQAYETVFGTEDRLEGLRAFAEKRSPRYTGH